MNQAMLASIGERDRERIAVGDVVVDVQRRGERLFGSHDAASN
jgi:hypothetical protein